MHCYTMTGKKISTESMLLQRAVFIPIVNVYFMQTIDWEIFTCLWYVVVSSVFSMHSTLPLVT